MPPQERFRHAQEGRASSAILGVEVRVSLWTAAKARKLDFGQSAFLIRFMAERGNYTSNPKKAQAISGRLFGQEAGRARPGSSTAEGEGRPHLGFRHVQPGQARPRRQQISRRSCHLSEATHASKAGPSAPRASYDRQGQVGPPLEDRQ